MHANHHVFVLFLHANHCIFLLYACWIQLSLHILACMKWILGIQMDWNQIQVIRGGEERQEDLMGGEWRRGEEEGCRKETLLWGAKAQETHCSRRHEGVQVKIRRPQMVTSLMKDDHSSSCCTSRSALVPKDRNQWIPICSTEQKEIFNRSNYKQFSIDLWRGVAIFFACKLQTEFSTDEGYILLKDVVRGKILIHRILQTSASSYRKWWGYNDEAYCEHTQEK